MAVENSVGYIRKLCQTLQPYQLLRREVFSYDFGLFAAIMVLQRGVQLLFLLPLLQLPTSNGDVLVDLPNGPIQGVTQYTYSGMEYNSFYGVRYGRSPVEELRFQSPQPAEAWEGVFDATQEKGICFQVPGDFELETEDCLLLNLYTPVVDLQNNASAGLPVMFFIHGGGFVEGSGILSWGTGPQFFIEYGVVMVAINYRIGPFGYLSTGDEVIPGNVGSKDQILALQWVKENIRFFGGDPDKVTIFGQSAGAASISYLLLSPLAEGLFRAAILESGSALNPWAYQRDQVEITYQTAALLNAEFETNRNSSDLLRFLQSVPAKELDAASYSISQLLDNPGNLQISKGFYWTPVIEAQHEEAFLTQRQYEVFEFNGILRVPILIGFNAEESMFMLSGTFETTLKAYDENTRFLVPFDFHVEDQLMLTEIGEEIKEFYSPDGELEDNILGGLQYHSTQDFDKAVIKQAELAASFVPVYLYEFTYSGKMGNNPYKLEGSGAVRHGEEQNYIFNRWYSDEIPDNSDLSKFPEADAQVRSRFLTLFTNFAKQLNPTPGPEEVLQDIRWPRLQPDDWVYLEVGEDLTVHANVPKAAVYSFWQKIYNIYAQKRLDSY
nr:carboxylesterase [Dendroctonus armandi]